MHSNEGLTAYQCFLRKQIELFEVGNDEMNGTAQGRNTPLHYGQVGIRCRHCAHLPKAARARGGVYYSRTIDGVCKSDHNFQSTLLCPSQYNSIRARFFLIQAFFHCRCRCRWVFQRIVRSSRSKHVKTTFFEGVFLDSREYQEPIKVVAERQQSCLGWERILGRGIAGFGNCGRRWGAAILVGVVNKSFKIFEVAFAQMRDLFPIRTNDC